MPALKRLLGVWTPGVIIAVIILGAGGLSLKALSAMRHAEEQSRLSRIYNEWYQTDFERIYTRIWDKTISNNDINELFTWIDKPVTNDKSVDTRIKLRVILALDRFRDYPTNSSVKQDALVRLNDRMHIYQNKEKIGSLRSEDKKVLDAMLIVYKNLTGV